MLRYFWPIIPAILIDGLQFLLSLGLSIIATSPGTAAGGFAGCVAGQSFLGEIGCSIGGFAFAIFGTVANPIFSPFTIPLGIALGFAITISLSMTFGAFLMLLTVLNGTFYLKHAIWVVGEITPGVNTIPVWTIFAIRGGYARMKQDKLSAPADKTAPSLPALQMENNTSFFFNPFPIDTQKMRNQSFAETRGEEAYAEPETKTFSNPRTNRQTFNDIRTNLKPHNDNVPAFTKKIAA